MEFCENNLRQYLKDEENVELDITSETSIEVENKNLKSQRKKL